MKLFIDSADISEIQKANDMGLVDGVTTNPSLLAKVHKQGKTQSFNDTLKSICEEVNGPVSAEVIGPDSESMCSEGKTLAKIHENIVVKIPMGKEGLKAVKKLSASGIKTNVTLVFSPLQALLVAKAGATYISPFVGRLDDISTEGMGLIADIVTIYENYGYETEVLVASIRHPIHVLEAARMGAHISTLPYKVMEQLAEHPLTTIGIERFKKDWESAHKTT